MNNAHVSCQGIRSAEGFLLGADCATNLLLARVVYGILVASEVVRTGEDCVACLARRGIDPFALVRTSLGVAFHELCC
jgi:hypothetical protein